MPSRRAFGVVRSRIQHSAFGIQHSAFGIVSMDPGEYSRHLEAYLCRKNDGHLVRIAGPAFEKVCGWAQQGIPLKIACRGVDRYFDRYYAKGPRRRPVRIEFCEADVLEAFDEWRRAVGVWSGSEEAATRGTTHESLPAHLQRVAQKLTTARAATKDPTLAAGLDAVLDRIEELRGGSRALRGAARTRAIEQLSDIDRALIAAVRESAPADVLAAAQREAEEELAAFAPRMSAATHASAVDGAIERLLRERLGLPRIEYGG